MYLWNRLFILGAVGLGVFGTKQTGAAELSVGDPAPDFSLEGTDGKTYKLSDFRDKQAVVLAWFPKAFTPGCTAECKSFQENGETIRRFDVAYFTISCDKPETNREFAESLELDYPILSDPDGKVAKAYGVVSFLRRWPNRWTFYIGKDGKILAIDKNVNTTSHAKDVAAKLEALGIAER